MNNKQQVDYGLMDEKERALYLIFVLGYKALEAEKFIVSKLPLTSIEYKKK